jgi:hypothetical protein
VAYADPPPTPAAPFSDWPVQHFEPRAGFYWYTEPAALVSQSIVPHGSADAIAAHNDVVDQVLARRADAIRAAGGLLIFCDWRSVKGYDIEARALQRDRMSARPHGYARRTILVIEPESRLLAIAADWLNFLASLALKSHIELVTRIDLAVTRAELRPPAPSATLLP